MIGLGDNDDDATAVQEMSNTTFNKNLGFFFWTYT